MREVLKAANNKLVATLSFEQPASLLRHFPLSSPDRIIIDFSANEIPSKALTSDDNEIKSKKSNAKITEDELNYLAKNNTEGKTLNSELTLEKHISVDGNNLDTKNTEESFQVPKPSETQNLQLNFPSLENFDKYRFQEVATKQHQSYLTQTDHYALSINQYERVITNKIPDQHFGKWGFTNLQYTPKALNGLFIAEAEIAYNPNDIQDFPEITLGGFREYSNRMNQLKLSGKYKGFSYGTKYMMVNDGFDRVPGTNILSDQEGGEFWLEKQYNIFKLKTFYSKYWNNVNKNPDRERKNITKTGVKFDINSRNLPYMSFTYSKGSMNTSLQPDDFNNKKEDIDAFNTYISYSKENWGVNFSGDYSKNTGVLDTNSVSTYSYYYLSGNYRPNDKIKFSPSIALGKEEYKWYGGGVEYLNPSASILVEVKEFYQDFDLSGFLSYNKYISDDSLTDTNTFDSYVTIAWNNKKTNPLLQKLSLKIAYLNFVDTALGLNSYSDYLILLNFRLASL